MNKNYILFGCNKKNKIPPWFKYSLEIREKNIFKKKKFKELFINDFFKDFFIEDFNILKKKKNSTFEEIIYQKKTEIIIFRKNPFELKINIIFYKTITDIDRNNIKDLIISWFLIGKNGGYQINNFKFMSKKNNWLVNTDVSNEAPYFLDLTFIKFDKNCCNIKCNLGVYNDIALDILINSFIGFNKKFKLIKKIIVN
uniref:Uncharacterized protein n=1 Tax=Lotharella vacuolata TaxID=74820 RepID=A0A0H5BQX1_9EUKA|nr:hypothetical protein [Lotharella vacuolata]